MNVKTFQISHIPLEEDFDRKNKTKQIVIIDVDDCLSLEWSSNLWDMKRGFSKKASKVQGVSSH